MHICNGWAWPVFRVHLGCFRGSKITVLCVSEMQQRRLTFFLIILLKKCTRHCFLHFYVSSRRRWNSFEILSSRKYATWNSLGLRVFSSSETLCETAPSMTEHIILPKAVSTLSKTTTKNCRALSGGGGHNEVQKKWGFRSFLGKIPF